MQRRAEVPSSDDQLLAACLHGDPAAWDTLVDRYAALIYSIPLKYGFREADAADVFQSVCVILLEKLSTVREPRGLAAWIITTTSRQCLALARHQTRERSRTADNQVAAENEAIAHDGLPEDEIVALERHYAVRAAVTRLPPKCRVLIEALFSDRLEQPSYQQVASLLGIPMNSLGPIRGRCLSRLRRLLTAAGYGP